MKSTDSNDGKKKESTKKIDVEESKPKCFVMMPFSTPQGYPESHFYRVYDTIIKPAIDNAGFEPIKVDEDNICDRIIEKILRNIIDCEMAICDLSSRNPNVMYELGIRQAFDKKVVLIQDEKTERIFDVSGISTIQYNSARKYEDVLSAQNKISSAIIETYNSNNIASLMSLVNLEAATPDVKPQDSDEQIMFLLRNISNRLSNLESENLNKDINAKNLSDCLESSYNYFNNKIHRLRVAVLSCEYDESSDLNRIVELKNELIELRRRISNYVKSSKDRGDLLMKLDNIDIMLSRLEIND